MKQTVRVTAIPENGIAEVFLERQSACSGDCHRCGGCGAVRETLFVRAEDPIGVSVGDQVVVETATGTVLKAAVLVYLLPVICFFAGYFTAAAFRFLPGLIGAAAAALGILPAVFLNRRMVRKKTQTFRIVSYAQEF